MLIKKNRIPIKQIIIIGILPSFLKIYVYRMKGYKIGKNVKIGLGSVIIGKEVEIGDNTSIGFGTIIRARSIKIDRFVKIGSTTMIDTEKIEIGEDAKINEQVFIGGPTDPESYIKIGKKTIIMQMSFLNPTKPLIIGDNSGIGGHCLLFTHGSWLSQIEGYPVTFAPITLGKNVWLPWRIFIMPGVTIGDNVVIGANSLVSKDLPSNCLAAGSPAKVLKENYPPKLSEENRSKIVDNIMMEFKKFMEYFGFNVTKKDIRGKNFCMNIKKKKFVSELFYICESEININPATNDNLLVFDFNEDIKEKDNPNFKMIINLCPNTRCGTSKIGEEFVDYIKRYGIRLDRID